MFRDFVTGIGAWYWYSTCAPVPYIRISTLFQDIWRIFGAKTSDIFSHDKSLIIGYSRILNPGYWHGLYRVRGPSEYRFFSVSIGFSRNKRAVTSQPVDFFAIGLRIRNPRGKPVLKTL